MPAKEHANLVIVRIEARSAGHVAYVTVNNPEKRNALNTALTQALLQARADAIRVQDELLALEDRQVRERRRRREPARRARWLPSRPSSR